MEQKKDNWTNRNGTYKSYEICCSQETGKYVKAIRDIEPGETIFEEKPLFIGPHLKIIQNGAFPCVGCSRQIQKEDLSEKCSQCGWPACSKKCWGLNDDLRHKKECKILGLALKRGIRTFYQYFRFDILMTLRALCLQNDKEKWNQLLCLEDHLHEMNTDSELFRDMDEKVSFILENLMKPTDLHEKQTGKCILKDKSKDLILKLTGIIQANAFELPTDSATLIVYPTANTFEQSCIPNVRHTILENSYTIRYRAALPISKNEHITFMYAPVVLGTMSRRSYLKKRYLTCSCSRCRDSTELETFVSALKCLGLHRRSCGGTQLPLKPLDDDTEWLCAKCKIRLPNDDVMKFVSHLGTEVDKVLNNKPIIHELRELLKKLLHFLHPNHYHLFKVKYELLKLLDSNEEGDDEARLNIAREKVKLCYHMVDIVKKLDPGNCKMSLILSSLLEILFKSKLYLLVKNFSKESKTNFVTDINDIKDIIEDSKHAIQPDLETESGAKFLESMNKKEEVFNIWLKENEL